MSGLSTNNLRMPRLPSGGRLLLLLVLADLAAIAFLEGRLAGGWIHEGCGRVWWCCSLDQRDCLGICFLRSIWIETLQIITLRGQ